MSNYVGQREAFYNVCRPQSSAKDVSGIVKYFELFFSWGQETNRYAQQYQNLSGNLFSF
jgi:hypothetical protein